MSPTSIERRAAVRDSARQVIEAIAVLSLITVLGTVGYLLIEDEYDLLDAVYMTVTTLSTVGFNEVGELSTTGRWFTVALIVGGIGAVFYTAASGAEFLIEGRLRDWVERRAIVQTIETMSGHVVLCGYGRFGRAVAQALQQSGKTFVVLESDPSATAVSDEDGNSTLMGSALEDEMLLRAGIERASALVAATGSDADNVFLTMAALELNAAIVVHARAENATGARRLHQAGAQQVISPHQLGGQRVANAIVRPGVVEFLELSRPGSGVKVDLEEIVLASGSPLDGAQLGSLSERGIELSVVAIKHQDALRLRPAPSHELEPGDRIVAVGDRASLDRLAELAGAGRSTP